MATATYTVELIRSGYVLNRDDHTIEFEPTGEGIPAALQADIASMYRGAAISEADGKLVEVVRWENGLSISARWQVDTGRWFEKCETLRY